MDLELEFHKDPRRVGCLLHEFPRSLAELAGLSCSLGPHPPDRGSIVDGWPRDAPVAALLRSLLCQLLRPVTRRFSVAPMT